MDNLEYKACKKCQCEFPSKIIDRYNGYCKNSYNGNNYSVDNRKPSKIIMTLSYTLVLVPILIFVYLIVFSISNSKEDDYKGYVISVAQEEIRELLYSPSSAKFPVSFDEYTITKSGDCYTVSSYVDADNLLGANIRQYYTVEFTMTGSETYIVDDIYLQDN